MEKKQAVFSVLLATWDFPDWKVNPFFVRKSLAPIPPWKGSIFAMSWRKAFKLVKHLFPTHWSSIQALLLCKQRKNNAASFPCLCSSENNGSLSNNNCKKKNRNGKSQICAASTLLSSLLQHWEGREMPAAGEETLLGPTPPDPCLASLTKGIPRQESEKSPAVCCSVPRSPAVFLAPCTVSPLQQREARGRAFPASRHLEVLLPFPTKRHGHLELPPPRTWASSPKGLIPWVNEGINAGTGVLALLKTHQQVIMTPNSVLLSNCPCLFCSTTCWLLKREYRGIPDLAIKFIFFFSVLPFLNGALTVFLFGF